MNLEILTIGKTKTAYIKTGIEEYSKRLGRYLPFDITEIADVKNAGRLPQEEQKTAEGEIILSRVSPSDYLWLLDERGKEYTSREFAGRLETLMASGKKRLLLVVGGPYGFSKPVYNRADGMLSLSKMTFNHEMVRLFAAEQIYRAMTILRGEPYHHD